MAAPVFALLALHFLLFPALLVSFLGALVRSELRRRAGRRRAAEDGLRRALVRPAATDGGGDGGAPPAGDVVALSGLDAYSASWEVRVALLFPADGPPPGPGEPPWEAADFWDEALLARALALALTASPELAGRFDNASRTRNQGYPRAVQVAAAPGAALDFARAPGLRVGLARAPPAAGAAGPAPRCCPAAGARRRRPAPLSEALRDQLAGMTPRTAAEQAALAAPPAGDAAKNAKRRGGGGACRVDAGVEALCSRLGTWQTARGRGPVLAVRATALADGCALGLSVHHSVADGRSAAAFLALLARTYRGLRAGEDPRPAPFPPNPLRSAAWGGWARDDDNAAADGAEVDLEKGEGGPPLRRRPSQLEEAVRKGLCLGGGTPCEAVDDAPAEDPEARCTPAFLDRSFSHPWTVLKALFRIAFLPGRPETLRLRVPKPLLLRLRRRAATPSSHDALVALLWQAWAAALAAEEGAAAAGLPCWLSVAVDLRKHVEPAVPDAAMGTVVGTGMPDGLRPGEVEAAALDLLARKVRKAVQGIAANATTAVNFVESAVDQDLQLRRGTAEAPMQLARLLHVTYLNEDLHRQGDFGHGPAAAVLPAIEWPMDFDENMVVMVPVPKAQGGGMDVFIRLPSRRTGGFLAQWNARVDTLLGEAGGAGGGGGTK